MSNETKRDLFEALADDCAGINDELYNYLLSQYAAALPDDLPVIPKAAGKFIKAMKANGDSLFASQSTVYLMDYLDLIPFDALKITKWINEHQNTFARAWLLGIWRVEETGEIVKLESEK